MLRILIIDESRARAAELCAGPAMAGHQVAAVLLSALEPTPAVLPTPTLQIALRSGSMVAGGKRHVPINARSA